MTFLEQQTAVGELLNLDVSTDSGSITNSSVKRNLNRGYRKVVNAVVGADEDYYVRPFTADIVASQHTYSYPADMRKLISLNIALSADGTVYYRAERINISDPESSSSTTSSATPAYMTQGSTFRIYPTPTENVTDGLELLGIEDPGFMEEPTDEPDIPLGYEDLPILYAVSRAKYQLGLFQEASVAMDEFRGSLLEMREELLNRELDGADQIQVSGVNIDGWA